MALLNINGVDMPTPSSYEYSIQDISKAERVASGDIVIDWIATKGKIYLKFNHLTRADLSLLLGAIQSTSFTTSFTVEYEDPITLTKITGNFYVGDRKMGLFRYVNGEPVWMAVTFNLIEV